jgi:hypothetical protein
MHGCLERTSDVSLSAGRGLYAPSAWQTNSTRHVHTNPLGQLQVFWLNSLQNPSLGAASRSDVESHGRQHPMAFDLVVNPFAQYAIFHAGFFFASSSGWSGSKVII